MTNEVAASRWPPLLVQVGRFGWLATGVLYALVGYLSIRLAAAGVSGGGASATEPSSTGAIETVARQPFHDVLLVVLAIGFLAFALWRTIEAFLPAGDVVSWLRRGGYLASALLYLGFSYLAASIAVGVAASPEGEATRQLDGLITTAWGRSVLVGAGVAALVAAIALSWQASRRDVSDDFDTSELSETTITWLERLATVGNLARATVLVLVGLFLVHAGVTGDSGSAQGMGEILRDVAAQPWGAVLVLVVGVGLIAYGAYCGVGWRHRTPSG